MLSRLARRQRADAAGTLLVFRRRLVDVQQIEEKVLNRHQVEKDPVDVPCNDGNKESCHSIQNVVICRGDDGSENDERVAHAHYNKHGAAERVRVEGAAIRHSRNSEADNERIAKVKGGHGSWKSSLETSHKSPG